MKSWWLRLGRYALPYTGRLALIVALMLVAMLMGLLAPWPLMLIVDHVFAGKPLPSAVAWLGSLPVATTSGGLLIWLCAATVGLFLLRRMTSLAQSYVEAGVGSRMMYDLAGDLMLHVQHCSLTFHGRQGLGDLARRVTADTSCVRELVLRVYLPLLGCIATICSTFVVMWQLSRPLAMFAVALTLPLGLLVRLFARPMTERRFAEWEVQGEIASLAEQTLTALPAVQAFCREDCEDRRFRRLARKTVQATLRSEISQHQFRVSSGVVSALALAVVMSAGGIAVLHGKLTTGGLLVMISYFAALYSPIETLAYLSEGVASAAAGARRVLEVFDSRDCDVVDRPDAAPLSARSIGQGISVRLASVTFGYEPHRPVLHNVSLSACPGEIVAVVGSTGAGKSTLVSLIARLFDPWQGGVYFNEMDIRSLQLASVRQQISIAPQEPFLLPLTIAENIAYSRPGASQAEIEAAAIAACAHSFIERLPRRYETVIGERGATLSGGEKQRISIARAMLKDAPIVIFDEPTAALDALTEAALFEALGELLRGKTAFIIAHRLSTILRASQVVVIENGRCVEHGTHNELLALGGQYRQLFESQIWNQAEAQKDSAAQGIG